MLSVLWVIFDLVLAAIALGLAWAAVATRDLRRGVVLFIAFGLLLTLIWSRLRAPDLALAEAAIGAGIAGALLLAALRDEVRSGVEATLPGPSAMRWINLGTLALFLVVSWGFLHALGMGDGVRLSQLAMAHLPDSGVSNPVTAVLLNYRAYDTLLELAVVFAAVLGVVALGPARPSFRVANPVLRSLIRWLVPLLIVTSVYLLWVGAHAPGGAFQAGATLAAAGILLRLGGLANAGLPGHRATRWLLVAGVAVFFLVGLWLMRGESAFLQYPQDLAGAFILVIEAAATLAIATALTIAYIGGRPASWDTSSLAASPEPTESDHSGNVS